MLPKTSIFHPLLSIILSCRRRREGRDVVGLLRTWIFDVLQHTASLELKVNSI